MNYIILVFYPTPRPDPSAGIVGCILGFWLANLLGGFDSIWAYILLCLLGTAVATTWFVQAGIVACIVSYLYFTGA